MYTCHLNIILQIRRTKYRLNESHVNLNPLKEIKDISFTILMLYTNNV